MAVWLALIVTYPDNYSMDAYQRWGDAAPSGSRLAAGNPIGGLAGFRHGWWNHRDATTGDHWGACRDRRRMGRSITGRSGCRLVLCTGGALGPFLVVSRPLPGRNVLLALFVGLALAAYTHRKNPKQTAWILADVAVGSLALVRYEGWSVTLLYIFWRRTPRAAVALWEWPCGWRSNRWASRPRRIAIVRSQRASTPASASMVSSEPSTECGPALDTKGVLLVPAACGLGTFSANGLFRNMVLGPVLAGQIAALIGWLIGLETATYRMQAIPGVLCGLFAAAALDRGGTTAPKPLKAAAIVGAVAISFLFVTQGFDNAKRSTRSVRWENDWWIPWRACSTKFTGGASEGH